MTLAHTDLDVDTPENDDGRRARRERNRDAVVEAMLELYGEGNLAPSSDEIASRAGLSPRSLFRYFDDIDDLCRAAIDRQQRRVVPLTRIDAPLDAPFGARVGALVEQRARVFDAIGMVGQVSRLRAPFQALLAGELTEARAFFRNQITRVFAAELAAMGSTQAMRVVAAVDVLCSFEAYQLLRNDQQLSRAETIASLADSVTAIVRGAG